MGRITISNITGVPPYNVYVSDQYANNKTLIGVLSNNVPPQQQLYLPDIFEGIDKILLFITDSSGCDYCNFFKLLDCREGCSFIVIIDEIGCAFDVKIDKKTCEVNKVFINQ